MSLLYFRLELEQIPRGHTIYDVAKLLNSDSLTKVMTKIDEFSQTVRKASDLIGKLPSLANYGLSVLDLEHLGI